VAAARGNASAVQAVSAPSPAPEAQEQSEEWETRRDAVVAAIARAFDGYARHAWGYDELRPLSLGGKNTFCGAGATIVDSLSTLYLANLTERFDRAAAWALDHNYTTSLRDCNLFETNIRIVGGLLSAGALSGRSAFYDQAARIARLMLPSFATASGVPCNSFPVASPGCGSANLAEIGTLQMEFVYLTHVTGDAVFATAAERVIKALALARNKSSCDLTGLYAAGISVQDGSASGCSASVGGGNDSFYEYLVKLWLLTNKHASFDQYKRMWDAHAVGALKHLVRCSDAGHLYVTGSGGGRSLEHLACYFPANLMLGGAEQFEGVAAGLAESCAAMYTATKSQLGADGVAWQGSHDASRCLNAPRTHEQVPPSGKGDLSISSPSNLQVRLLHRLNPSLATHIASFRNRRGRRWWRRCSTCGTTPRSPGGGMLGGPCSRPWTPRRVYPVPATRA
jgi:mannosyl-oligosaccharide alpha-1,2-mannosidase